MEKGPLAKPRVNDSNSDENDNNEDEGLDIENDEEEDLALWLKPRSFIFLVQSLDV